MRGAIAGLFCLVCLVLICSPAPGEARFYDRSDEALWSVRFAVYVTNTSSHAKDIKVVLPLITDDPPCQQVISRELPAKPVRTGRDGSGNTIAVWKIRVLPGERLSFSAASFKVKTFHIRWSDAAALFLNHSPLSAAPSYPAKSDGPSAAFYKTKAEEIGMGENGRYYLALKCYDHILKHYHFTPQHGKEGTGTDDTIQCRDAAQLYTGLLNASGIEAEFAGGIFITPGISIYRDFHAWSEILVPEHGRIAVDPTLGRFNETQRLKCFFERRTNYISVWRGEVSPLKIESSDGRNEKDVRSFTMEIEKISGKRHQGGEDSFREISCRAPHRSMRLWKSRSGESARMRYREALRYETRNEYIKAVDLYFSALGMSSRYQEAADSLLRIYRTGSQADRIYNQFRKGLHVSDTDGLAWYALGEIERQRCCYSRAAHAYSMAEKCGYITEGLYYSRMLLYERTKELQPFSRALSEGLSINDCSFDIYKRALFFYMNLEMWDSLCGMAAEGRGKMPDCGLFPAMEGYAYLNMNKLQKARKSLDEALRKDPTAGWYHCVRGWIMLRQGDRNGAEKEIEKGINLGRGVDNPKFFRDLLRR